VTVVSNTTPLHYLVLIEAEALLPALFETVLIPHAVRDALAHPHAPPAVRAWVAAPPAWLRVNEAPPAADTALNRLDPGEREALTLAEGRGADLVLLAEREARAVARQRGLRVAGTLGVLEAAAERGLIDLPAAVERLRRTNVRLSPALLKAFLERNRPA
jgi:predicted nucleic acid-binding protein